MTTKETTTPDNCTDDMSATDPDAIETKTADNMSATATDTAATKDMNNETRQTETKTATSNNKSISLFIVTDKPQPFKLPTLKQLDRIPMYVERFKTDFKQRNNTRVYRHRVSNKKTLKKAYNDFVGIVSCYNDKCAIGGKVAAGGSVQAVNTS